MCRRKSGIFEDLVRLPILKTISIIADETCLSSRLIFTIFGSSWLPTVSCRRSSTYLEQPSLGWREQALRPLIGACRPVRPSTDTAGAGLAHGGILSDVGARTALGKRAFHPPSVVYLPIRIYVSTILDAE